MRVASERSCAFGPLLIAFDDHVLHPRPWTTMQSEWAAELSPELPQGPMLELCAGAGHIGILAARLSGRALVQVECEPRAVEFARRNARSAGIADAVEIRCQRMEEALASDERFPLILADPPYLPKSGIGRFPDDPELAIDGGEDGLDVIRTCLDIVRDHLEADGVCLLQVAGPAQVDAVRELVASGWPALAVAGYRAVDLERAVMQITRIRTR